MGLAEKYLAGLKAAYEENGGAEQWAHFEKIACGVSPKNLEQLRKRYPDAPESLIGLLERVDGTYWRVYAGEEVLLVFLGSDLEEFPYHLFSAAQICEWEAPDWLKAYIDRDCEDEFDDDDFEIDDRIIDHSEGMRWLHFADCTNNGGSSQLFIDLSPAPGGTKGQIVRYIHDPDALVVIADSFDDYLRMLMDNGYDFINEDIICE